MCPVDGEPLLPEERNAATALGHRGAARAVTPAVATAATAAAGADPLPALDETLPAGFPVGEYQVTEKIGEGGMGVVYAGVHPLIGKKVAIKLLNLALSQDPVMVQRFVQEARAVNQIGQHNIVDIFAFGQLPNGRHYFVMEYLQGRSLKHRLQAAPPLRCAQAFEILGAVCDALSAAHAAGIVHRDLKPDNMYLVERGPNDQVIKLLDFGIAKLLRRGEDLGHTRTGAPIGTPFYMSPEQCRSKEVDARSDLYAMGVIMFEMFTGRRPFNGLDYIDIVNGHLQQPPPLPTDYAAMPVELEALILHCLEKDPAHRPQTAAEIAARLREIAAQVPAEATLPTGGELGAPTTGGASHHVTPRTHRTASTRSRTMQTKRRGAWAALLTVALLGAGAAAWLGLRPKTPPLPPSLVLDLSSQPAGAQVFVDGRLRTERTPARLTLPSAPELALRLEHDGYRPHDEVVRPVDGLARVAATLEPLPSGLRLHTNATKGIWRLDDQPQATTGGVLQLDQLAPGVHRVRIESRGFEPREESITFAPGQVVALDWTLQPAAVDRKRPRASSALPDAPTTDFRAPR